MLYILKVLLGYWNWINLLTYLYNAKGEKRQVSAESGNCLRQCRQMAIWECYQNLESDFDFEENW